MLRIVFMGTPYFSVPILEALIKAYQVVGVVTQPDKFVGRKRILTASPVKECAMKYQIPVFQPKKIRTDYENILALKPDLIVTAAYGQIIGEELLYAPIYKAINVHASLLPKYRGGAPIQHALINGDKETGITIMYMEKAMDAGAILNQSKMIIEKDDTTGTLFDKLKFLGRDLLMATIPLLIKGEISPIPQNEDLVTYAYTLKPADELLDFAKPASDVLNYIKAFLPEPMAYFLLDNVKIKVINARLSAEKHHSLPGEIIYIGKDYFSIACQEKTAIDILAVLPAGKKPMKSSDFINGTLKRYPIRRER